MAIRSKCAFNNVKKIDSMIRVYQIVDKLKSGREISFRRLIELITRFYTFYFTDYESIADFSNQLQ
jgi:hypothetical protein